MHFYLGKSENSMSLETFKSLPVIVCIAIYSLDLDLPKTFTLQDRIFDLEKLVTWFWEIILFVGTKSIQE